MEIKLEVKKRNRDFGIITWPYKDDFEIKTLFECKESISVNFDGKLLKNRKVSYKFRRFSIGKKRIESLGQINYFLLSKSNEVIKITPMK